MHACFSLLLISNLTMSAQVSQEKSNDNVGKDGAAVSLLNQTLGQIGWKAADNKHSDAIVTGTITRAGEDENSASAITIKYLGKNKAKVETTSNGLTTTTVMNGNGAVSTGPDGKMQKLHGHASLNMMAPMLPFLTDIAYGDDADVSVKSLGQKEVRGELANGVEVSREPDEKDLMARVRRLAAPIKIWISVKTGLPIQIDYFRLAVTNYKVQIPYEVYLRDYRTVNGISIPFRQEISVHSQPFHTLQFTNVKFNSGLAEVEFTLPQGKK